MRSRSRHLIAGKGGRYNAIWLADTARALPLPRPLDPHGEPLAPLEVPVWFDDDEILARDNSRPGLVRCQRLDGWQPTDELAVGQFGELAADGRGGWAATIRFMNYTTVGRHRGRALPARVQSRCWVTDGRDGALLFQDFDVHHLVLWPSGELLDCGVALEARLGDGGVILRGASDGPIVLVDPDGRRTVAATITTPNLDHPQRVGEWVSYAGDGIGRVLHHAADPTRGYRLTRGYSPELERVGGLVYPAVATNEGEIPTSLVRDPPIELGQNLEELATPVPPAPDPDPPADEAPASCARAFTMPAGSAMTFEFSEPEQHGDTTRPPLGNLILVVEYENAVGVALPKTLARVETMNRPLVVHAHPSTRITASQVNVILAWLVTGATFEELVAALLANRAARPHRYELAYLDDGNSEAWPAEWPEAFGAATIPIAQCYRGAGESRAAARDRFDRLGAIATSAPSGVAGFWYRTDTQELGDPEEVARDVRELYAPHMRRWRPRWVLGFSDGREGGPLNVQGTRSSRTIREAVQWLFGAIPGRPSKSLADRPVADQIRYLMSQDLDVRAFTKQQEAAIVQRFSATIPPADDTRQAPDREAVVAAVIASHPTIDACDEASTDTGRALLVDWAAQRLNRDDGRIRWGRKSRGAPDNGIAVNPNTDAITFLRDDGRFEIYDVINGRTCTASWVGYGPFRQGENGWFAPPQCRPEPLPS